MTNLLLDGFEFLVEETPHGTWRRYVYPTGAGFAEFKSHKSLFGWPLIHYTRGVSPERGRRIVAMGVIAVGRMAVGGLAIGQASAGLIAVGQAAFGLVFGLGQLATGVVAVGQLAMGLTLGVGQLATGRVAVGQLALGKYVLAQKGVGRFVWSPGSADPTAVEFFGRFLKALGLS